MKPFKGSKEGNTILSEEQQRELATKIRQNQKRDLADLVIEYINNQQQRYKFYKNAGQRSEIRGILGFELTPVSFDGPRHSIIINDVFKERAKLILQNTKKEIEKTLNITRSYWSKLEGWDGGFDDNRGLIHHFCQDSPINSILELSKTLQKQDPIAGLVTGHGRDRNQNKYLTILLGADYRGQRFYSRCYIKEWDQDSPLAIEYGKKVDDDIIGLIVPCAVIDIKKNNHKDGGLWVSTRLMHHLSKYTDIK